MRAFGGAHRRAAAFQRFTIAGRTERRAVQAHALTKPYTRSGMMRANSLELAIGASTANSGSAVFRRCVSPLALPLRSLRVATSGCVPAGGRRIETAISPERNLTRLPGGWTPSVLMTAIA